MQYTLKGLGLALPALALVGACQTAVPVSDTAATTPLTSAARVSEHFEADRQAILAMAGDYHVTFDFTETVPLSEGYELKERKVSGGFEVVRVIEDEGDFISLQHILVVGPAEAPMVVKHWRQDWQYEPDEVMMFIGGNAWQMQDLPDYVAAGQWSQVVYQVDDSPRYGAVGFWEHEDGVSQWEPPREWRPLPRRDMTTRSDYHAVDAINRHAITPFGWVHEQDNTKLVLSGENPEALVREIGINTYRHDENFDPSPAVEYWDATKDYWAFIREEWEDIADENQVFAVNLKGETEDLYLPILQLADQIQAGEIDLDAAKPKAREALAQYVTAEPAPLQARLRPSETQMAEMGQ
ncbi:MAG: hypothetical protein CMK09_17115 [Ponticaulis sp.]|nr:hypothetical protein [Ponticaulis sp.]|tara:strand:- start:11163 stop:12221 length:1059 start_codon:yes stop_codon:yes gene_type:complete